MGDLMENESAGVLEEKKVQDSDDNNNNNNNINNNMKVKTVAFSEDEEKLVARMFNLVGERWGLIAGRIPGRTAEEVEKYWTSRYGASSSTEKS